MRVRLVQQPNNWVNVESKRYWFSPWVYRESFCGDGHWEKAKEYAEKLLNPIIIEVLK